MHKAHPSRGFLDMPPYRGRVLYMYVAYHKVLLLACAIISWKVVMCTGVIMNISKYVQNDNFGEEVDMAKNIIEMFYQLGDWERRNSQRITSYPLSSYRFFMKHREWSSDLSKHDHAKLWFSILPDLRSVCLSACLSSYRI